MFFKKTKQFLIFSQILKIDFCTKKSINFSDFYNLKKTEPVFYHKSIIQSISTVASRLATSPRGPPQSEPTAAPTFLHTEK
jgi:hypothetical protein